MTHSEENKQQDLDAEAGTAHPRRGDDRRGEVKPTDSPVPRSPEAEEDAVRAAEEQLGRIKPY